MLSSNLKSLKRQISDSVMLSSDLQALNTWSSNLKILWIWPIFSVRENTREPQMLGKAKLLCIHVYKYNLLSSLCRNLVPTTMFGKTVKIDVLLYAIFIFVRAYLLPFWWCTIIMKNIVKDEPRQDFMFQNWEFFYVLSHMDYGKKSPIGNIVWNLLNLSLLVKNVFFF